MVIISNCRKNVLLAMVRCKHEFHCILAFRNNSKQLQSRPQLRQLKVWLQLSGVSTLKNDSLWNIFEPKYLSGQTELQTSNWNKGYNWSVNKTSWCWLLETILKHKRIVIQLMPTNSVKIWSRYNLKIWLMV